MIIHIMTSFSRSDQMQESYFRVPLQRQEILIANLSYPTKYQIREWNELKKEYGIIDEINPFK